MAEDLGEAEGRNSGAGAHDRPGRAEARNFTLTDRARSIGFAGAGLSLVLRSQHNAWVHAVATLLVLGLGFAFPLSGVEWCALIIAIASVWSAEAMNTALELLADAVSPAHNPLVGQAKDAAAGAVLVLALAAAVVGFIILGPHCLSFLRGIGMGQS